MTPIFYSCSPWASVIISLSPPPILSKVGFNMFLTLSRDGNIQMIHLIVKKAALVCLIDMPIIHCLFIVSAVRCEICKG